MSVERKILNKQEGGILSWGIIIVIVCLLAIVAVVSIKIILHNEDRLKDMLAEMKSAKSRGYAT